MTVLRVWLFCPLILLLHPCNKVPGVDYIDATEQAWFGGPVATHGIYYKVYFLHREIRGLRFDSLWIAGKRLRAELLESEQKGDTVIVFAHDYRGIRHPQDLAAEMEENNAAFPIASDAAAILGAFAGTHRVFIPVRTFRKLPALFYP
ncbi:MAG: hypothetical protein NZL95_07300 [Chitinophagales bacterium]|nr:hypothetical protein [Chitinophagales bacterium]MDW8428342.1 hypothetical protein [Chitinophagales bacterium]